MKPFAATICVLIGLCLAGCGMPSLLITPVQNTNKLEEIDARPGQVSFGGAKLAIIELEGLLINAKTGGVLQPTENKLSLFTQQLERAAADPAVKAVVLRINSPGGTVTCSDTMYQMLQDFRRDTKKPVVASAQEVCASGAYYIACGSDAIVASPTTVVGSIGVILQTFEVSGTMAKLGIKSEAITSGPMKDMGSPFRPLDPGARQVMQGLIDEYYARFVGVVTSNRAAVAGSEQKQTITDGRVFSGEQAMKIGLVDRLGTLEDAIALAQELSRTSSARVIMYRRPFGYGGSIYADAQVPQVRANVLTLQLPESDLLIPRGFYYLWQP